MRIQLPIAAGLVFAVTARGGAASSGARSSWRCSKTTKPRATKLRDRLPVNEAMTAGMFMAQAPLECAAEDEDN